MSAHKIIAGMQDAIDGNIARATFFVDDLSGDMVTCPRCDMPHSWSAPDHPPAFCVWCGVEFSVRHKSGLR